MRLKSFLIAMVIAVSISVGIFVYVATNQPAEPNSALIIPQPNRLADFELLDQRGQTVTPATFAGQWDLVFFGFTNCPDVCPATLQILAAARSKLQESGIKTLPRIVLISVDPERDTPEAMAKYVDYFGTGNLGVTGDMQQLRALTSSLGIFFEKRPGDGDNYNVDHSAAVLVIDPQARFHALFSSPHVVDNYVHDLPIIMGDD